MTSYKSITLISVFAFLVNSYSLAAEVTGKTEITDVKIYSSGAIVNRTSKVTIDAGQSVIRFENLSPAINPSSIVVNATGTFTILSINHQLDYLAPDRKTPEMQLLHDSLQTLNRKRDGILNKISVLQEEQNLLLANKEVGGNNNGVKLEDLRSVSAYIRERLTDIKEKITDYSIIEKKLKEEIDKINREIGKGSGNVNNPFSTILVNVNATAKTQATFSISYFTGNVSWSPHYDVRVADAGKPVNLVYKALVTQQTAEEWKNVKLTISSGNPTLGGQKPEIKPWYLTFYPQDINVRGSRAVTGDAPAQKADPNAIYLADEASAYVSEVQNTFATEYDIALPYTILPNGLSYAVEIKDFTLPASYAYYSAPAIDRDAFLTASVSGWTALDLLSGSANVYYENNYVGETTLNTISENDTLRISLGRDKRIVIKRDLLKDEAGNRLLGGNRVRKFTYEITVKNNRKESILLFLEDQVPVSRDKEIAVDNEIAEVKPDESTGKITWKLEIAPGAQVKKLNSYTVKYPKDKRVNGM